MSARGDVYNVYTAMDQVLIPVELQNQDDDVLSSTRQLSQTAFCLRGMTETTRVPCH